MKVHPHQTTLSLLMTILLCVSGVTQAQQVDSPSDKRQLVEVRVGLAHYGARFREALLLRFEQRVQHLVSLYSQESAIIDGKATHSRIEAEADDLEAAISRNAAELNRYYEENKNGLFYESTTLGGQIAVSRPSLSKDENHPMRLLAREFMDAYTTQKELEAQLSNTPRSSGDYETLSALVEQQASHTLLIFQKAVWIKSYVESEARYNQHIDYYFTNGLGYAFALVGTLVIPTGAGGFWFYESLRHQISGLQDALLVVATASTTYLLWKVVPFLEKRRVEKVVNSFSRIFDEAFFLRTEVFGRPLQNPTQFVQAAFCQSHLEALPPPGTAPKLEIKILEP